MEILHSKILGEGKPLLILHGFMGMSDNWRTLGAQFAEEGYQVHLIDQRNHGKSFHSPDFDYNRLSTDVINYIAHYQLEDVRLLGHSMGGKTAMQLATSQPGLVTRLIVADIAPKDYPPPHRNLLAALAALDLDRISSRKEADEALSVYLPDLRLRQFLLKNLYWADRGKLAFRLNLEVLRNRLKIIGGNINPKMSYEGPTLFLRGDQSDYITPDDIPEIKKLFPKVVITVIENAGHWLHAENTSQFFEKTLQFLK